MENTLPFLVQVEVPGFAEGRIAGFRLFVNLFTKIQHNLLRPFCPSRPLHPPDRTAGTIPACDAAQASEHPQSLCAMTPF